MMHGELRIVQHVAKHLSEELFPLCSEGIHADSAEVIYCSIKILGSRPPMLYNEQTFTKLLH